MTQALGLDGLSRSTLLSLIAISTALVMFAIGATFAATVSDDATGNVKAGTFSVNIAVYGAGLDGALAFTTGASTCANSLQPGDFCTATVTVENTSGFTLLLLSPTTAPVGTAATTDGADPSGCADAHWPVEIDTTTNFYETTLLASATTTFVVKVTLDAAAPLGCQNETATVTVTVNAST